MAPAMHRFSLEQGLFGCCSSCHTTVFGQDFERPFPFSLERTPLPPALVASALSGDEKADCTPHAALASGLPGRASPRTLLSPAPALLVDAPSVPMGARRPTTPPAARDPAAKAMERARLRKLVNEFTQEAALGRPCTIVFLEFANAAVGLTRRGARYELLDEVERLVLRGRAGGANDDWEPIGSWPLEAVLGVHRAEDSALVQSHQREVGCVAHREELARSAVLEFGGGACTARRPVLLIEESVEHCERLVKGLQILRLYKGAANRLESARGRGGCERRPFPSGVDAPGGTLAPHAPPADGAGASREGGQRVVRPNIRSHQVAGTVGADEPPDDGRC